MISHWRYSAVSFIAVGLFVGLTGCEGCEPEEEQPGGCAAYCTDVMAACTGANVVYATEQECLDTCAGFPTTGAVDDDDGDTLQCRTFHAAAAADDASHCAHASPQGGNVCGGNCTVFCRNMVGTCDGFDDEAGCLATCSGMNQEGAWNATDGNSVQCRTFHAMAARGDDTHCPHAGITGGGVCGDDACEAYCDQAMANCDGAFALYPDRAACVATCANMPADGAWDATDGNSVQCRAFHAAGPAAGDPAAHCGHASANGGGDVCGSLCDGYCDQVMANCSGGNELYADRAACTTACGAFPVGSNFATAGDSVQCRTFHGSYPAAADPGGHCGHASPGGDNVCYDEPPPAQSVTINGEVHELGSHLNGTHTGVVGASILAYGVAGGLTTTTGAGGAYTLNNVPANGQAVMFVSQAGSHPTYQTVSVGSINFTAGLVLTGAAWMTNVATTHGVNLATSFACQNVTGVQCVWAMVMGQVLDDGTGAATAQPVAGVSATDFTVTGGDENVPWNHQGPFFLNADGTANAGNSTTQTAGLYVVFVEIPQTAAGYDSLHIELAIQTGTGNTAKYYGPTHTAAYRAASTTVTWADVPETGVPPGGGGGNVGFDGQIYPLFLPVAQGGYGCQGCHTNQGGANPAGGLNLYGGADVAYAALNPGNHPTIVNLDAPEQSTLLVKPLYQGGGAQNHPIFAWVSTQDPAYLLILQWIQQGAQRVGAGQQVSFLSQIKPLLGNGTDAGGIGCVSCHIQGTTDLALNVTASEMYNELVNEAAQDGSGSGEGFRVNKAGYPERSLLLTNLLTASGEAHPQKPFPNAADARYQLLYRWIAEGYKNDGYCEDYCTDIETRCTGGSQQYDNHASCLSACGAMPRGAGGDTANDTAECRIFHTGVAANDAHCEHGGFTGGNTCGGWCDVYCRNIQNYCAGANQQYGNTGACLAACGGFATDGAIGDLEGNTVQCRLKHLTYAGDDVSHCEHAGEASIAGACQ